MILNLLYSALFFIKIKANQKIDEFDFQKKTFDWTSKVFLKLYFLYWLFFASSLAFLLKPLLNGQVYSKASNPRLRL